MWRLTQAEMGSWDSQPQDLELGSNHVSHNFLMQKKGTR